MILSISAGAVGSGVLVGGSGVAVAGTGVAVGGTGAGAQALKKMVMHDRTISVCFNGFPSGILSVVSANYPTHWNSAPLRF